VLYNILGQKGKVVLKHLGEKRKVILGRTGSCPGVKGADRFCAGGLVAECGGRGGGGIRQPVQ